MNVFKDIEYLYMEQINADLVQLIFYLCVIGLVACVVLAFLQFHFNRKLQVEMEAEKQLMLKDGLTNAEIDEVLEELEKYVKNNTPTWSIVVILSFLLFSVYIMFAVFPDNVTVDYNAEDIAVEQCFDKVTISSDNLIDVLFYGSYGLTLEHISNTQLQELTGIVSIIGDYVTVGSISFEISKLQEETVNQFMSLKGEEVSVEYYEDMTTGATLLSSLIIKHIDN